MTIKMETDFRILENIPNIPNFLFYSIVFICSFHRNDFPNYKTKCTCFKQLLLLRWLLLLLIDMTRRCNVVSPLWCFMFMVLKNLFLFLFFLRYFCHPLPITFWLLWFGGDGDGDDGVAGGTLFFYRRRTEDNIFYFFFSLLL